MRSIFPIAFVVGLSIYPLFAKAESVSVAYRGDVDLKSFDCSDVSRSSLINRVCYNERNAYMLISLNGKFYHYCEIYAGTVSSLLAAPSMGTFYNTSIRGKFDCRTHHVPDDVALAAPSKGPCAVSLIGFCVNHYTPEEEAEREKRAILEAELKVREHVSYRNGLLSISRGLFTTTFPADTTHLHIDCSYDEGMEVVFENDKDSSSVRIGMAEEVCDGIAQRLGPIVVQLMSGD
jgi:KTSC domain